MGAHTRIGHRRSIPNVPTLGHRALRETVCSGDILLCAGTSVFSKMIQHATRSPWSHVALVARVPEIDRIVILESVESVGVRAVPLEHYLGDAATNRDGYDGELLIARHDSLASMDDSQLREILAHAVNLLGRAYDKAEIVRIATRIARYERRTRTQPASLQTDDAYICSEFVWECLRAGGLDIVHDPRGFIAPCDFLNDKNIRPLCRVRSHRGSHAPTHE